MPRRVEPQLSRAAELDVRRELERLLGEAEPRNSFDERLEHHTGLHPGHRGAETEVDPLAEGDVAAGVVPMDVEPIRVCEASRIAVRRGEQQVHRRPGGDVDAAHVRVAVGDPPPAQLAAVEPDDLLDGCGDERRVGADLLPRVTVPVLFGACCFDRRSKKPGSSRETRSAVIATSSGAVQLVTPSSCGRSAGATNAPKCCVRG